MSVMQRDALFELMKIFTESHKASDSLENIKVKIRFIQCNQIYSVQTFESRADIFSSMHILIANNKV